MLLVVFLALKNTPLAFLTSWSYERLNVLHQVSGSMTLVHVILHVSLYCSYFVQSGRPSRLLYTDEIFGMVAGLCFFGLAFSGIVVRRWWYELFYYMHFCFWAVGVVMVGLHQPDFSKKILFVTCVTGGIWGMDRLLRLARILMYSVSNEVTLQPLSNGGTRVTLKKPPLGAMSGKHCFLWIPKIRSFETHPFTIAATDPMEFVIASYDGFTSELHQYATRNPGASLKASVDGSYGTFPAVDNCDKMILVAGGSGASFTFGTALNALQKMKADDKKTIIFIWIVKQHCEFTPIQKRKWMSTNLCVCPAQLTWFARHIKTLESDDRVSVRLYVTRPPAHEVEPASPSESLMTKEFPVGRVTADPEKNDHWTSEARRSIDFEKGGAISDSDAPSSTVNGKVTATHSHIEDVPIIYRRPDVADILRATIIDETPVDRRVLVMGCGPDGLMRTVRDTSAACIRAEGPAVEVHCEQFGW